MEAIVVIAGLICVLVLMASLFKNTRPRPESSEFNSLPVKSNPSDRPSDAISNSSGILDLLPHQFVVLDLETTGLSARTDEIIEFGAIRVNLESDNHDAFNTLVRPQNRIPKKITEITGITQKMVESDGIEIRDAMNQFIEFIGDLPLVTYNAEFDMGFLYSAAEKHGFEIKNSYTCALKRARRAWPGLPSYRLDSLARVGKLSTDDTHRALGDCKRALIIFTSATSAIGQKVRWTKAPKSIGGTSKTNLAENEKFEMEPEAAATVLATESPSEAKK